MKKLTGFFKKKWWLFLLVIFLVLATAFFLQKRTSSGKKTETYKAVKTTATENLSLSGKIEATEKAILAFPLSGKLNWIGVKEGDMVKKWQTVASLDQTEASKNLEKTLRDYAKQRNDFEQTFRITYKEQTPYSAINDTVKRILEKNQWDLEKAVLDVELKDYSLKLATLTTPVAGIVTKVAYPLAGVHVALNTAIIEIVNPETVYFSALSDQTEVVKLAVNKTGKIVFDSFPDKEIEGNIYSIGFTPVEGETGTVYEVKIALSQADFSSYRLGMTGDINFILKERTGILAIPSKFVISENDKNFVYKKVNGRKEKIEVTAGETFDSQTEITSGLTEGDVVTL